MLEEQAMITFLKKFDEHPFLVKINGHEHLIGEGAPTFTVNFKKVIPLKDLVTSTSLALGEAYMDGDLDIEGNLYQALDNLLGQMGKFSTDEHHLKSIMFPSSSKKNQRVIPVDISNMKMIPCIRRRRIKLITFLKSYI